jgi:N utilization substance protein A
VSEDLSLTQALRLLSQEKNIDEFLMLEKLEQSLAATYQRILDLENPVRVTIDRETGRIYVFELIPVGEWDEEAGEEPVYEERDVTPTDVSRIAAQAAKNVIGSIIRDAERERIFDEYADRVGESVTGTVQQSAAQQRALRSQPAHQGLHHRRPQDLQ